MVWVPELPEPLAWLARRAQWSLRWPAGWPTNTARGGSSPLGWHCWRLPICCCGAEEPAHLSTALHLVALVIGVVVLDMGAQMTQVANQTRIFGLVPSARSRLNTVYMTVYFTGAASGSALATIAWVHWRWNGVCGLALGLIVLAGIGMRPAIATLPLIITMRPPKMS